MFECPKQIRAICLAISGSLALAVGSASAQDKGSDLLDLDVPEVEAGEFDTFNIQVQDTELVKVLEMLALQAERNIIPSRNVAAVVSVNLFDVTFEEALDAILTPNGFASEDSSNGKFIYVYTQEELQRKQQLERKTEARMFELEHLSAGDAAEFSSPLLSERGKLSFIGDVEGGIERDFTNMGRDDWAHSAILVVNDYPENLGRIADLLGEIDTSPKQVVIDATIASVRVLEEDGFGVDFSVIADLNYSGLLNPMSVVSDMLRGNKEVPSGYKDPGTPVVTDGQAVGLVSTPGNVANGKSTFKLGVMAGDASVFIRALDTVTDTVVLARPRLMALNRQRAQVLVGRREPYLSTTSTDTTTTQTVQYLDTGVKLMFRPFISKDGSIRMELYPSVSKAERVAVSGGQETIIVPAEDTNEISTNVRVNDGETLVLGGLFQEQTTITNRQVPFIGDIPIIGAAFTGYDNAVDRREIIFLITPTIVHDELIRRSGKLGQDFVKELRVGTREGLLPWSRERRSSQHNQDALQAINSGDFELAMFHVDNSLRLNSAQPKMKHLRNQINEEGDGEYYDADMWDSALSDMIRDHREELENSDESSSDVEPASQPEVAAPEVDAEARTGASAKDTESAATPKVVKEDAAITALLAELQLAGELIDVQDDPVGESQVVALEVNAGSDPQAADTQPVVAQVDAMPEEVAGPESQDQEIVAATEKDEPLRIDLTETFAEEIEPLKAEEMLTVAGEKEQALDAGVPEVAEETQVRVSAPEVAAEKEMNQLQAAEEETSEQVMVAQVTEEMPVESNEDAPEEAPVASAREKAWLRVWWLAGLATEDATAFARAEKKREDESTEVAEVNDEED